MQWDAVVAIPGIEYSLAFPTGHLSRLVEGRLRVVGLTERMLVQCLEINGVSWLAVLLFVDHHAVTPRHWRANGHMGRTSWSRPAFTSPCQGMATGIGVWQATGVAFSSSMRRNGGPDILGKGWWGHVLNVL